MKILLTGAAGQQGQALRQQVPAEVELIATCRSGGNGLLALDLAETEACRAEHESEHGRSLQRCCATNTMTAGSSWPTTP